MRALVFSAGFLLPSLAFAQVPTPAPYAADERPMLLAPQPVADPDGADAILSNPAALALDPSGDEIVLVHSESGSKDRAGDGDALFMKSARLLNVGVEWARPSRDVDQPIFTFATAIPMDRTFAVGLGYSTTLGKLFTEESFETWSASALWRPIRFVSFGGTAWNATTRGTPQGYNLDPRYAGGIAIRPLPMRDWNERLTLTADVLKTDGQRGEDVRVGARLEALPGLHLYATADEGGRARGAGTFEDLRFSGGIVFSFVHGGIGSHAFADRDGEFAGTSTRLRMRQRRQPTMVHLQPHYARVKVGGMLPDESVATLFSPAVATLPDLLHTLAAAREDESISGVFVKLDGFGGGMARAQEIRRALADVRAAGKKVFCYVENADTKTYYVASACDRVALHPAGMVMIDGVSTTLGYAKGTLDKLGVQMEVARVGAYKNAPEPFLQKEPSKEQVEVVNALLDNAFEAYVNGIAEGRKLDAGKVRALIDGAFYPAEMAKKEGLVDYLAYPDDVRKEAKDFLGKTFAVVESYRSEAPASREWGAPPQIGVIYASGAISQGESGSTPLGGDAVLGSKTLVRALKQAGSDPRVKAVVLRVDSPGGDGFASDEVWHEVVRLKKQKPVVVSMSDVAASGGYYIAMAANEIFVQPSTVTGSIGVFILRPNFQGTFEKIDWKNWQYSRGALSEVFSPARPMTPHEKETLDRLVNQFYREFITKAAESRGTTVESIDAVARGHVWTGAKAKELKLVDSFGGLEQAVERARELAKISRARRVEWRTFPEAPSPFDRANEPDLPDEVKAILSDSPYGEVIRVAETARLFAAGRPTPWLHWWTPAPKLPAETAERENPWWPLPDLTQ